MKKSILFLLIFLIIQGCKQNKDDQFNNEKKDTYLNPVLAGDYPDPSVVKVGDDYYMTHSSFEYVPGLLIWHSKDLVNWEPVCNALNEYLGSVFAPDLIYHDSLYYIYFPVAQVENGRFASFSNFVITSKSPEGPWSDPMDLKVGNIDPGHVVDDEGNRYLMLSKGYLVPLNETGDSLAGEMKKVYDGWEFPDEYLVECFCLESPKYTKYNDYYYLTVAEGGTAGPATSHMIVSSRSKTPWGPWEHSPYNPIVKTWSADEKWWSKGHGTLVEGPLEEWYIFYHGYEKGFYNLGRQTLMEPIEWTADDWFKVPEGVKTDQPIAVPEGEKVSHGLALSDDFNGDKPGLQWRFYKEYDTDRFSLSNGELVIKGKGNSPADCGPLLSIPGDHAYQIETKLSILGEATGGLVLFYNEKVFAGIGANSSKILKYERARAQSIENKTGNTVWLRIINDKHQVSFYYSDNGEEWIKYPSGAEVSAYHHNAFGNFLSLRAGIYSAGKGTVKFDYYDYKAF